jgi:long-chain acyl-CoA synthetase
MKDGANCFKDKKLESIYYNTIYQSFLSHFGGLSAGGMLVRAATLFADNVALITSSQSITYKELYKKSVSVVFQFHALGIKPHDRVILLFENSVEFFIAYWAVLLLGGVVVPVNTFLHINELKYILHDADPALLVVSSKMRKVIEELQATTEVFERSKVLYEADLLLNNSEISIDNFIHFDLPKDQSSLILYTSGTTGYPKGVMLSAENIVTNGIQAAARLRLLSDEQERFFAVLPLFHAFAQNTCIWLPAITGSSVVVVPKIDRSAILEGLALQPTVFFGFPALYGLLCLMKKAPLDSIKLFVSGADAMPDKIRAAFGLLYGRKILSGYGLTEASPVVSIYYHNSDQLTTNVGRPVVGVCTEVRDEYGVVLGKNQIGTLWIKGANVMAGYYHAQEATDDILQQGWLCTGDLASLNEAGEISIHGRSKDLIIHKGFNIYPQEIENVLLKSALVMRAAVIGKPDDAAGQVPVAYISLKSTKKDIEKELRTLCANHLAAYKIPRIFIFMDNLPISSTGKVDKKQLHHHV